MRLSHFIKHWVVARNNNLLHLTGFKNPSGVIIKKGAILIAPFYIFSFN